MKAKGLEHLPENPKDRRPFDKFVAQQEGSALRKQLHVLMVRTALLPSTIVWLGSNESGVHGLT